MLEQHTMSSVKSFADLSSLVAKADPLPMIGDSEEENSGPIGFETAAPVEEEQLIVDYDPPEFRREIDQRRFIVFVLRAQGIDFERIAELTNLSVVSARNYISAINYDDLKLHMTLEDFHAVVHLRKGRGDSKVTPILSPTAKAYLDYFYRELEASRAEAEGDATPEDNEVIAESESEETVGEEEIAEGVNEETPEGETVGERNARVDADIDQRFERIANQWENEKPPVEKFHEPRAHKVPDEEWGDKKAPVVGEHEGRQFYLTGDKITPVEAKAAKAKPRIKEDEEDASDGIGGTAFTKAITRAKSFLRRQLEKEGFPDAKDISITLTF